MIDGWGISCKIALRWLPLDLTDEKLTLVQVMAWCHQTTSFYLSQCWSRSLSPNGVTRSQWVNTAHAYPQGQEVVIHMAKLIHSTKLIHPLKLTTTKHVSFFLSNSFLGCEWFTYSLSYNNIQNSQQDLTNSESFARRILSDGQKFITEFYS